jgi:hypothetical protein
MPPHNHGTSESAAKANCGPGRVRRGTFHPPGGDVRTGRRVSHYHPQAPPPASSLSDVRPRPDQIAAGLCGGCCRCDLPGYAASRDAFNDLRVWWPARLLLRAISQSRCAPSWPCAPTDSNPACRLACTRRGLRNAPESAPHAQSSGTDANRHRVVARDAWICWTWDFAALGRGNPPVDAVE